VNRRLRRDGDKPVLVDISVVMLTVIRAVVR
jgi:hypothetical protein